MDFDELCERVGRNDPELTTIDLYDDILQHYDNEQLSRLGDAAQENTVITELSLDIPSVTEDGAEFHSLLNFIEVSPSLNLVRLSETHSALITHQFVHAISRSNKVKEIHLHFVRLGADSFAMLLRSTRCFCKRVALTGGCDVVSRNGQGAEEVISAFRENRSLEGLVINAANDLLLACLLGLESHPTLTRLHLLGREQDNGVGGVDEVARIVASPGTLLESLCFRFCNFQNHALERLVQALNVNASLDIVSFQDCSFDATAKTDVEAMLRKNNESTEAKSLGLTLSGSINLGTISETALFFSRLLQEKSSCLSGLDLADAEFEGGFGPILTAILSQLTGDAELIALQLGELDGDLCRMLAESIPKMKRLKNLKFEIDSDSNAPTLSEQEWLHVFESNSSLTNVEISGLEWSKRGLEKMQYLSERNQNLESLLVSPPSAEMPLSLRPTLYHAALKTQRGMSLVVRDLVALGNTVCDKSRRKRRRPDYYSPSRSGKSKK